MGERMTSREDAAVLKNAINGLVSDFDSMGFSRAEIGAALAGVGIAMVQVHVGRDEAARMAASLGDLLQADGVRQ